MKTDFRFSTDISVRYADTDANGHVFFANYLTYFDIAMFEYFKAIGYGFDRFVEKGLNVYYAEALSRYKAGARFDDLLQVHATVEAFGNTSFTARFAIRQAKTGELINTGHIVVVVVDQASEKKVPVPEAFKNAVRRFEGA